MYSLQKEKLLNKVDELKPAEWDIEVPHFKVKGKDWLKSQVSRAFLPKYFPNYVWTVPKFSLEFV